MNYDTGALEWSLGMMNLAAAAILRNNVLYIGTVSGQIHAVNPATGVEEWQAPFETFDGQVKGFVFPDFHSDIVYASTTNTLWAVRDLFPGPPPHSEEVWRFTSAATPSIPLYPPGSQFLWVGSENGLLYEIDVTTGGPGEPTFRTVTLGDGSAPRRTM